MKILMVDSLIGNDYAICLCNALIKKEIEVNLAVPENRSLKKLNNIKVFNWLPSKGSNTKKLRKIYGYLKYILFMILYATQNRDVVIHYQFFRRERIDSILFVLLKICGAKMVHTAHNVLPHQTSRIDYFFKLLVYRFADKIIAHSTFIKNELKEKFHVDNKITIIPHGNFDLYVPEKPIDKPGARQFLKLNADDHVVLFFGVIRKNKGLDLLLDAFEIAAKKDKYLKLVIAGSPQNKKLDTYYKNWIANSEAKMRILYHGSFIPSNMVPCYFSAADIVALPYKTIYHSGVAHLAFSFGVPVVATNVGDFSETVTDRVNGYILEENNKNAMAKKLQQAFMDKNKLEQMGFQAKKISAIKYDWQVIGDKTLQLYRR